MPKPVFLVPGFMATQLVIISEGVILWWDPDDLTFYGPGKLRLAPNGVDPGPPDGVPIGLEAVASYPWSQVLLALQFQLDPSEWQLGYLSWDWRKDPLTLAGSLAQNIRDVATPTNPATLVAHSAGGILSVLAWAQLVASGDTAKVRRIITLGTPFQGSYGTIDFLAGTSAPAEQLFNLQQVAQAAQRGTLAQFNSRFLNALALTWPNFYELLPTLGGSEAAKDPQRVKLYTAANYPAPTAPSQTWLDYARNVYQPAIAAANTFPPVEVATYVAGTGIYTWESLGGDQNPLNFDTRINDPAGDGVVTVGSALRSPGAQFTFPCAHASLPLGLSWTGDLAAMIKNNRQPPDPPPPFTGSKVIIGANTTDPGQQDPITGFQCIGGHC